MPYFIAEGCVDVMDMSCVDECPVDCIYEGDRKLYINPGECIDCGQCEAVCPQDAIYEDRSTPPDKLVFVGDNARFFAEPLPGHTEPIGEPGGSGQVGRIGVDTELVGGWPAR